MDVVRGVHRNAGRKPRDPFELEARLEEYLCEAREVGVEAKPLDLKSVARAIGCSHTHFSPKTIEHAPAEFRRKWEELRLRIAETADELRTRKRTRLQEMQRLVARLRRDVKQLERERDLLWVWLIQMEAGLCASGINTELYVPDEIRHRRAELTRSPD